MKKTWMLKIVIILILLVVLGFAGFGITKLINPDLFDKTDRGSFSDKHNSIDMLYGVWKAENNTDIYSKIEILPESVIFYHVNVDGQELSSGRMSYRVKSQSSQGNIILQETGRANGAEVELSLVSGDTNHIKWKHAGALESAAIYFTREGVL